jgi:hypothetical protein
MTNPEETPEHPAFPERLTAAIPATLLLRVPLDEAVGRLRLAVETGARVVEVGSPTTDRRLTGEISGESVRLSVADSDWAHRRKGWKVEFVGRFGGAPVLALRGTVGIANHRLIRWLAGHRGLAQDHRALGTGASKRWFFLAGRMGGVMSLRKRVPPPGAVP